MSALGQKRQLPKERSDLLWHHQRIAKLSRFAAAIELQETPQLFWVKARIISND